jgi:hypothetical protein
MRSLLVIIPLLIGCGRVQVEPNAPPGDDAGPDAAPDAISEPDNGIFGAGCALGLKMDEAAWTGAQGEVIDSCGGDNNGTAVQGAVRVDDPGRGRIGEFPVPSGCVQISDAPVLHATTGLTLSAWIFPQMLDRSTSFGVLAKRNDFTVDDAEYTIFVSTANNVWVDIDSHNDRNHGARELINGAWQQITVVFDGTLPMAQRVKIYVDGQLDTAIPETSTSLTPYPSGLTIGCMRLVPNTQPQIGMGGRIDDVGVWTRSFSAQDVIDWYRATKH